MLKGDGREWEIYEKVEGGGGKWVHFSLFKMYICCVWMDDGTDDRMDDSTRRTKGWKASFRPRCALLYKNIRSPFLYLFFVSVFLSSFFVFFAFLLFFFFHFFFHFFFQIGFLNNN